MRKIKNLVIGGIQNKVFNLILISMLLTCVVFGILSGIQSNSLSDLTQNTSQKQVEAISETTDEIMQTVVRENLTKTTNLEALICNELFSSFNNRVHLLENYASRLFNDPDSVVSAPYAAPDKLKNGEITAQLILADDTELTPELERRIGIAANMSDMMMSLYSASEVTNSCFIALPEGAFIIVDDRSLSKFEADGSLSSFDPRTRSWYQMAVEAGDLIFTDVGIDWFTDDIEVVCAMPVYDADGNLTAVVGSDLFLTTMQRSVQASEENGGFLCVINENGHVVFSPKSEGVFGVYSADEASDLRLSEDKEFAQFIIDALNGDTDVRIITVEGTKYYAAGAPMNTVGWALISVYEADTVMQPTQMLTSQFEQIQSEAVASYNSTAAKIRNIAIGAMIVVFILVIAGALILSGRIVKPLNHIVKRISELSEGNIEFKMEDAYKTGDEIEVLAESFAAISHRTVNYVEQVKNVTAEKERISTELHMARQIQESMLPGIFPPYPERKEFDIYATMNPAKEVGGDFYDFFLIDNDHLGIVMADVSGKGVPAALFMMVSKIILQSCAMLGKSAAEILTKTNEAICSNNAMEMFVTVWFGILEISTGKITASNAGHEYPSLKQHSRFMLYKDKHGFVIGGMDGVKYTEYTLELTPGDKLFLYTDGVPEATNANGELFGTERMLAALNKNPEASPTEILRTVRQEVDAFVGDAEQFDDLTMLCLEYKGN